MTVPLDGRVFWIGTAASIPSGWARDTDFDDVFLQGVTNDDRGTDGGVHDHGQTHTHTGTSHTHVYSAQSGTFLTSNAKMFGTAFAAPTHSHDNKTSNAATITYQSNTNNTVIANAQPPFVRAIVIKPDDANQKVPDGAFCFTDESTAPTGFSITGSGGTTDYDDLFLFGAVAGNDGGGTGGSTTHGHADINHSHNEDTHQHDQQDSMATIQAVLAGVGGITAKKNAHHRVTLLSTTTGNMSTDVMIVDDATFEPDYYVLMGIENTSGSEKLSEGVIVAYVGTIASLPGDWIHQSSIGTKQLKITKTAAEIGDTGGSNNHVHNFQAHGHTHTAGHNHNVSQTTYETMGASTGSPSVAILSFAKKHLHTWDVDNRTPTLQNKTAFDSDSSDGRYNYREVIFIKHVPLAISSLDFQRMHRGVALGVARGVM